MRKLIQVLSFKEWLLRELKSLKAMVEDDYNKHCDDMFWDNAPLGADFEHWANKNCLSFDDYKLEIADIELIDLIESLEFRLSNMGVL